MFKHINAYGIGINMPRHRKSNLRIRPRAAKKARALARRKKHTAIAGPGQRATCVETYYVGDVLGNSAINCDFTLGDCPRAQLMSTLFDFYKAVKVTYTYEALFNTFQDGTGSTVPQLYEKMNRQQERLTLSLNNFQAAGSRPRELSKKLMRTYKPNWCSPGLLAIGSDGRSYTFGRTTNYGWLATRGTCVTTQDNNADSDRFTSPLNPGTVTATQAVINNNILYNGHVAYVDQAVDAASGVAAMRVVAQITWAFKGAKSNYSAPAPSQVSVPEIPSAP